MTRFSLFFPEKREFFLENLGTLSFGSVAAFGPNAGGETTLLFYSRRIGLEHGQSVPVRAAIRLGRSLQRGGAEHPDRRRIGLGGDPTNFTVVRLKRDLLRRSSIGAMFTGRSVSDRGSGSNQAYGVDGTFSFYDSLDINAYWAQSTTDQLAGDDVSYQTQLDYAGDLYSVQLEWLVVGRHFNPEVGLVRPRDMYRDFASFRYSPRPTGIAAVRKLSWVASVNYIENRAGQLETREQVGEFGIEFENTDAFLLAYSDTAGLPAAMTTVAQRAIDRLSLIVGQVLPRPANVESGRGGGFREVRDMSRAPR